MGRISNMMTGIALTSIAFFLLAPWAAAEREPNNGQNDAERIESGETISGTLVDPDNEDWYYVRLGPLETVEVTLKLTTTTGSIWVYEIFEGDEEGGVHIDMDVDPGYQTDSDSYTNDEPETIKLFLRVAGDGGYDISVDISGGSPCCSGCLGFAVLPLLFLVDVLALIKRFR